MLDFTPRSLPLSLSLNGDMYVLTPAIEVQRKPTLKWAFFGSKCSRVHIVPVPVERPDGPIVRSIDLAFRSYINIDVPSDTLVYNLDHFITLVDRYPSTGGIPGPHRFAIFRSGQVGVVNV